MTGERRYVHVAIPRPLDQPFTYRVPDDLVSRLQIGSRVRVPFGPSRAIGFVEGWARAPRGIAVKSIGALLDETEPLLDATLHSLTRWVAARYGCSWAEAAEAAVPPPLRHRPFRAEHRAWSEEATLQETAQQAPAWATGQAWHERLLAAIERAEVWTLVLQADVAQRMALYRQAAARAIATGRTVLWLVPEVAASEEVERALDVALRRWAVVMHGGLRAGPRRERWLAAAAGAARLVVGTRSAIFARLPDLGLVIVDEESDPSYKPEQTPRYHARDVARERARIVGVPLIWGDLVPSLEARALAQRERGEAVAARAPVPRPTVTVVDMREEAKERRRTASLGFSRRLERRLEATLGAGGRAFLFLNRRGFATTIRCPDCGYVARCQACGPALVYHFDAKHLLCHYCGASEPLPELCPSCGKAYLRFRGVGTERLESEVHRLWPTARTARLDSDAVRRPKTLDVIAQDLVERRVDVVVGTQLVRRSLGRWPTLDLVGVMAADRLLSQPDFRAAERTLQWLTRLAGLAAGPSGAGELIVQTFAPEHPVMQAIATGTDEAFWEEEWRLREAVRLPPTCHLIQVECAGRTGEVVDAVAGRLAGAMRRALGRSGTVTGPLTPPRGRGPRSVRRLLVRAPAPVEPVIARLRRVLARRSRRRGVRIHLDVDPV